MRVPLLRRESTRVEFLIHPPLFPLFFSRHVFLSACYDFSLFFFSLFLRGHSLCNNFPVVLACVLCTFLFPSPLRGIIPSFREFLSRVYSSSSSKENSLYAIFQASFNFYPRVESRQSRFANYSRLSLFFSLSVVRSHPAPRFSFFSAHKSPLFAFFPSLLASSSIAIHILLYNLATLLLFSLPLPAVLLIFIHFSTSRRFFLVLPFSLLFSFFFFLFLSLYSRHSFCLSLFFFYIPSQFDSLFLFFSFLHPAFRSLFIVPHPPSSLYSLFHVWLWYFRRFIFPLSFFIFPLLYLPSYIYVCVYKYIYIYPVINKFSSLPFSRNYHQITNLSPLSIFRPPYYFCLLIFYFIFRIIYIRKYNIIYI